MNPSSEPEQPAQFAFRIVEASGANIWYAAIVKPDFAESIAREIASVANDLQPGSSAVERVDTPPLAKSGLVSGQRLTRSRIASAKYGSTWGA